MHGSLAVLSGFRHPSSTISADLANRNRGSAPQRVECKSFDATPLEGWLLLPPGATPQSKAPRILFIHGGPHSMYGYPFSAAFQLLCACGYAVLYLNPRGSTGYGAPEPRQQINQLERSVAWFERWLQPRR